MFGTRWQQSAIISGIYNMNIYSSNSSSNDDDDNNNNNNNNKLHKTTIFGTAHELRKILM
jgi:hypothetical protein